MYGCSILHTFQLSEHPPLTLIQIINVLLYYKNNSKLSLTILYLAKVCCNTKCGHNYSMAMNILLLGCKIFSFCNLQCVYVVKSSQTLCAHTSYSSQIITIEYCRSVFESWCCYWYQFPQIRQPSLPNTSEEGSSLALPWCKWWLLVWCEQR